MYDTPEALANLEKNFGYNRAKNDQGERYLALNNRALNFAQYVVAACPDTAERTKALTKIEEAVMWSIAAIARHE